MKALIVAISLLLLIVHIWLSRELHNGPNKEILTEAVQPKLKQEFGDVSIRYEYLDGTLEGTVATRERLKQVEDKARQLTPAGRIINNLKLADIPATLLVQLSNNKLTLIGSVPQEHIKKQIGNAAGNSTAASVLNLISIDSQTNADWLDDLPNFFSEFFEDTTSGEVEITGEKLRLKRSIRASAKKKRLLAYSQKWQLPLVDEIVLIRDQPEKLLATLRDQSITISGQVPTESVRAEIAGIIEHTQLTTNNQLVVKEDVVEPRWNLNDSIGNFFKNTTEAELEITPERVRIKRKVDNLRSKLTLIEMAKLLMPSASLQDEITFTKAPYFHFDLNKTNDNRLELSGWLPDTELKESILTATRTRYPNLEVYADKLYVNPTVNLPEWSFSIPGYIEKLPKWEGWNHFSLSNDGLNWTGMSDIAKRNFSFTPSYFKKGFPQLPPTQPTHISVIVQDDKIFLTGETADINTKNSIETAVERSLPNLEINNRIKVDPNLIIESVWSGEITPLLTVFLAEETKSAEFEITPSELRLKRKLKDRETKSLILTKAKEIIPSHQIVDQLVVSVPIPELKPANLLAVLENDTITITGNIASEGLKKAVSKAIIRSLPNTAIKNQLIVDATGIEKPTWAKSIAPILADFFSSKPASAEFEINSKTLRLKQGVANLKIKQRLATKAQLLLTDETQFVDQLTISRTKPNKPALVTAVLSNKTVILSGQLPSNEEKAAIISPLSQSLPNIELVNNITIDDLVITPNWISTFPQLLNEFLAKTDSAEIEITPTKLRLKKQFADKKTKNQWLQRAKQAMPRDIQITDQLSILEAEYEKKLKNYVIYFDTNSTWIKEEDQNKMREAAALIKEINAENRRLLVKGYADSRGEEIDNKRLSKNRAISVVELLTSLGVDQNSVDIIAVGEAEAGNSYDEDRRVEVLLVK